MTENFPAEQLKERAKEFAIRIVKLYQAIMNQ